ncbi:hypothetical protein M407DRAFT_245802 [Tulasnella calospora MUT 4182]|uniref:Uncharacterized protein n=1 Tax=Tulasnella calospora MUT 4182 TaxID=1051891 RepID=A0A0C3Q890_9AGAM|nr:hypothetical protein M407DRAFT_245802 [Tulasnella calospora MUT 4182]
MWAQGMAIGACQAMEGRAAEERETERGQRKRREWGMEKENSGVRPKGRQVSPLRHRRRKTRVYGTLIPLTQASPDSRRSASLHPAAPIAQGMSLVQLIV